MNVHGISFDVKNIPVLDKSFIPLIAFNNAFLKSAKEPFAIVLESSSQVTVYDTFIHGTDERYDADCFYADRLIKLLLWQKGGYKITVCGSKKLYEYISKTYSCDGGRVFDFLFMSKVYDQPFKVLHAEYNEKPKANEKSQPMGRHLDGCRIGFDAGGSDRKVSAVNNGEVVFSEEVVWYPKISKDPDYHFNGIVEALKTAASKLPRVDAVGVSSAGIYIDNYTMVASLFLNVSPDDFNAKAKDIYIRAAKEIGDVPLVVANDGDVTALAGAMDLNDDSVLGIAMGTSEAGGYVDKEGNITGWLNELAFVPVDISPSAALDEWSGDIGCGVKYFSQDAVIKLAPAAGIHLDNDLSPAQKLKIVQQHMEQNHEDARLLYQTIGTYLGHSAALYASHYDLKHILLLGRVMSGEGGTIILNEALKVLHDEYPQFEKVKLHLPDENSRRVGQSVAAASLPKIKG